MCSILTPESVTRRKVEASAQTTEAHNLQVNVRLTGLDERVPTMCPACT